LETDVASHPKFLVNRDIVLISGQMLNDRYWTSKQYISHELIKQNRVLYVEANYSFGKLIQGLMGKSWPVTIFGKLKKEASGIDVLTPPPRLPWRNHFKWIGRLNQAILGWKIRKAIGELNYEKPIIWTFLHQTAKVIEGISHSGAIYHCVDDWPELLPMAKMGNPEQIKRDEWALIIRVGTIFTVSDKLLSHYQLPVGKVHFIPNGVDTTLFNPDDLPGTVLTEMSNLPRPIIGFSGSLGRWIDIDLIIQTARSFPAASVVIIGLNEKNPETQKLAGEKNIHFLGMKSRSEVPNYIREFDVCLMPFARTSVGQGLLPLKLFEYLSMGKPIIATNSGSLEIFRDVLYLADDSSMFIQQVKLAISEVDTSLVRKRREKAHEYSWPARIQAYDSAISQSIDSIKIN